MITDEYIKEQIEELKAEQGDLKTRHDATVAQYQQIIVQNQNRFQQITGAIQQLEQMLNGKEP